MVDTDCLSINPCMTLFDCPNISVIDGATFGSTMMGIKVACNEFHRKVAYTIFEKGEVHNAMLMHVHSLHTD